MVMFKSIPEMFKKEISGIKPNTVRKIDEFDERFKKLAEGDCRIISIVNTETEEVFQRIITDVSIWGDLMIISWEHKVGERRK